MEPETDYAGREDVGRRQAQEDYYAFACPDGEGTSLLLAVLGDGMGGAEGGALASRSAVEAFIHAFRQAGAGQPVQHRLTSALEAANQALARIVDERPDLDGMGTTLVGVCVTPAGLDWVSVGDSPLYLYRSRYLQRLNADHSMQPLIDDEVRLGRLSPQDAARHPERNALRSVVGGEPIEMVDASTRPVPLQADDVVVLASDGLLTLREHDIQSVLQRYPGACAGDLAERLSAEVLACDEPGQDNLAVMTINGRIMTAQAGMGA
ncbi:PP2C family serine/threonine-protein phosphatase [Halorhodospira sp. 9622]|uniref:PP2C family protein-serine/threonine phosphatase n=1 Tax=Halorhodospira sp. 9622 TaxID=2899136 RepID=UPI001EE9113F|nr:protein phosphatase 2C domain-containing protein [Halorhodospira sp. 9622]MCG5539354.1 protein phosphatase 2C domain-containing protein [Halorhodospira sp. 9622]